MINEASIFKSVRHSLGWSLEATGRALCTSERTIRRWEDGTRYIPGTAWIALQFIMAETGYDAFKTEVAGIVAAYRERGFNEAAD